MIAHGRRVATALLFVLLAGCAAVKGHRAAARIDERLLRDAVRGRDVPVAVYVPARRCARPPCGVVLLGPGYGLPHTAYGFLAESLAAEGMLVVAVQHVLPGDTPPPAGPDVRAARTPMWREGTRNLCFVHDALAQEFDGYDWTRPILIGHSNGGDVAALLLVESPQFATTLVTLDHRRQPLPRDPSLRVLSLRGSDFEADPGVLPATDEPGARSTCIVRLRDARHDDMHDGGPDALKARLRDAVRVFLVEGRCPDGD